MTTDAHGISKVRHSRVPVTLTNVAKLLGGVAGIFYAIWFFMLAVERFATDVLLWLVPIAGAAVGLVRPVIGGALLVAGGAAVWLWSLTTEGGLRTPGIAYLVVPAVATGALLLFAGIRNEQRGRS